MIFSSFIENILPNECCFHLQIKVLLMAVKDFNPDCGDSAYTMGIVDLLLECVELSYRPGNWLISFPVRLSKKNHIVRGVILFPLEINKG